MLMFKPQYTHIFHKILPNFLRQFSGLFCANFMGFFLVKLPHSWLNFGLIFGPIFSLNFFLPKHKLGFINLLVLVPKSILQFFSLFFPINFFPNLIVGNPAPFLFLISSVAQYFFCLFAPQPCVFHPFTCAPLLAHLANPNQELV